MKITVNGVEQEIASSPLESLLHVLREELGITSPKAGCQQGGCGACTVLVGDEPRRACLVPVAAVDGAEITTVEGFSVDGRLRPVQAAFYHGYAAQCGFCTSGFLVASEALLRRNREPGRDEIIDALSGHVCRCTGYVKIVNAVEAAARGDVAAEPAGPEPTPDAGEPEILVPGSPA